MQEETAKQLQLQQRRSPSEDVSGSRNRRCAACSNTQALFLHLLPYRGVHSHLCTGCVLAAHPGSFCPICFDVFVNNPPSPRLRLVCFQCPTISHLACVSNGSAAAASSNYLCPRCSNPNFTFFNVTRNESDNGVKINLHLAKQLVAAASIAFEAMNDAAVMARINAEIKVKEALLAKAETAKVLDMLMNMVETENNQFGSKFLPRLVSDNSGNNGTGENRLNEENGCSSHSSDSDD